MDAKQIHDEVKKRYGDAARAVQERRTSSCCGGGCAPTEKDPISRDLYAPDEGALLPEDAVRASLGCGNPTALADLRPGETVLDLGSGGGIDVILSARRVGASGRAYGLDMTPEMIALARKNLAEAGVANAEILEGHLEAIPLPEASVDVIVSNCVVNLSPDKDRVLREAFRVLKPGGRFAVSDIVLRRPLPDELVRVVGLWTGCVAGALVDRDYLAKLAAAGFADASVEVTREYEARDAEAWLGPESGWTGATRELVAALDGAVVSAFVRARKP